MKFENIFTQYDESIEKSVDVDPLGFGSIWTYFGQQIFENKISSATFDIRNFNINLFNHYIVKKLSMDNEYINDKMFLNKKETIEKLLIVLENMLIYSWWENQSDWGDNRIGLLGTSKAISKWTGSNNIEEYFDISKKFNDLELLKNQKTTGVNGTYKGSFIAMFNSDNIDNENLTKDYDKYFENGELFKEIQEIIEKNKDFKTLSDKVIKLFDDQEIDTSKIPTEEYSKVFKNHKKVSKHTKKFWLKYLGFKSKEAKLIYDEIDFKRGVDEIIEEADLKEDSSKFTKIISLEPKLNYYEKLFYYLLQKDGILIEKLEKEKCITFDYSFEGELKDVQDEVIAKERLENLSNANSIGEFIEYHKKMMDERGEKSPWIRVENNKIKVTNINAVADDIDKDELTTILKDKLWGERLYYIGTVASIKRGFEQ
ncbi:MAG: hypothetical protein U9O56_02980 [Campylobacterota bacterium]|nr:hypothetical protein [Campylobacterota bacterium]